MSHYILSRRLTEEATLVSIKTMKFFSLFVAFLTIVLSVSQGNAKYQSSNIEQFLVCLSKYSNAKIHEVIYTPKNASYTSILNLHIQNKRFKAQNMPKPLAIITAKSESHVQATVTCARSESEVVAMTMRLFRMSQMCRMSFLTCFLLNRLIST